MVKVTGILLRRSAMNYQPDSYWRKRQILKLSAEFYGRARNCYSIAIRHVQKYLLQTTDARSEWKRERKINWEERITAATQELGYMPKGTPTLLEALAQEQILLNRQVLADLAIWEPRTFKAINQIAGVKAHDIGLPNLGYPPNISRKTKSTDPS